MKQASSKLLSRSATLARLGALAGILGQGCAGSSDELVTPRLEIIDQTRRALTAGTITSIAGTYGAACDGRDPGGADTWTLSVSGGPAVDELSVRKNDSDCVLTFATIATAGATFLGAPVMALSAADTFKGSSSAFAEAATPLAFYGNAKISALSFATDFTITLLVSDTPAASDEGNKAATFATENGAVSASTLLASNYTIDFSSFNVSKDVGSVVQSVSGYAQLTAGSTTGQDYAIYEGSLTGASLVDDVETAYAAATTAGTLASLTTLRLPASGFGLAGVDLHTPTPRTIIIRNADHGVASYQLLLVTFTS
jgi:hypothetical protein